MITLLFVLLCVTLICGDNTIEITLPQGVLQGEKETLKDQRYFYSFRGLPYAQPPIGDLRFKDPVPTDPWEGVLKSARPHPCLQLEVDKQFREQNTVIGQEDCLKLNVHTPDANSSRKFPVMVFIHGGAWRSGSIGIMGGEPELLMAKDIVFVPIQYRLGTLGFLSTEDSVIPGNLGLKDQTLALRWIKHNIIHFGGDPDKITIFGQSAGSASCHYQMLTPSSEGLFHQVILQSGTSIAPWAMRDDHAENAMKIAKNYKCPGVDLPDFDSTKLLYCLQGAPVEYLAKAEQVLRTAMFPVYMSPRVDGYYIPALPSQLLKERKYHKVNMMSGVTQNEASFIIQGLVNSAETSNPQFMETFINYILPLITGMDEEENSQYLTKRLFFHYLDQLALNNDTAPQLEKLIADAYMNIPQDETSIWHGIHDDYFGMKTFRYELEHRGQWTFSDMTNHSYGHRWVCHLDDLQYLFNGVLSAPPITRLDDIFLNEIMVTLWTNFAKYGDPTPNLDLGFKWNPTKPSSSLSNLQYLSLTPAPEMKHDTRSQNREFWRNLPLERNKRMFPNRSF